MVLQIFQTPPWCRWETVYSTRSMSWLLMFYNITYATELSSAMADLLGWMNLIIVHAANDNGIAPDRNNLPDSYIYIYIYIYDIYILVTWTYRNKLWWFFLWYRYPIILGYYGKCKQPADCKDAWLYVMVLPTPKILVAFSDQMPSSKMATEKSRKFAPLTGMNGTIQLGSTRLSSIPMNRCHWGPRNITQEDNSEIDSLLQ